MYEEPSSFPAAYTINGVEKKLKVNACNYTGTLM